MNRLILTAIILLCTLCGQCRVLTGIEVLKSEQFKPLQGKRIGLITNPTGVDSELNSTIDILAAAPGVKLTALFSPEHGVRGDVAAGAKVSSTTDPRTGLKVHSLYGATRKPTAAMLQGIDAMVYDIQDIGCRSYTFISTLGKVMEACVEQGKELIVLDRPNPLGGERVEGASGVDPDCKSFVSQFSIPYIYGLTVGEFARWLNATQFGGKCKLQVVAMKGWERNMDFAQTGLPWVPTSPNIPTAETTLFYPATGILGELGLYSIGANYTMPFQVVTGADINADSLATRLNALQLPGVRFRPCHLSPGGKQLHGVQIYFSNPQKAELTTVQFYIIQELAAMYPGRKPLHTANAGALDMFDKVTGSKSIRIAFKRRHRVEDMIDLWRGDAAAWRKQTAPYLLY